jgi:hypothetical protein
MSPLNRRSALKSTLAAIPVPAGPALATIPAMGTKPVHSQTAFRKAFDAYIAAYRGFYGRIRDGEPADDEPLEVHRAHEARIDALQDLWSDARERLAKMVVENHGYNPRERVAGVGALSVDIDGLTLVAAGDPDDEGESTSRHQLVLVPRSREMFKLLDELPVQEEQDWKPSPPPQPKYPVDLSRMPAGEPAPFDASVHENLWKGGEGTVRIERHFTMDDSPKCQRCWHCSAVERCHLTRRQPYMKCEVIVPEADVETVLYGPTPVEEPMSDTEVKLNRATSLNISVPFPGPTISGRYWVDLIVMTRKAWKRSVCSEDRSCWF